MNTIFLQVVNDGLSEWQIVLYIAGSAILFIMIRSFIRNPSQFLSAMGVRVGLVIFSIMYFFWDHDIINDDLGIAGYFDDIGVPVGVYKYIIIKQFPFPRANNQNADVDQKTEDGAGKNPPA